MRFTSLIVELIRARPRMIFWIVVLAQAALWLFLPWLVYGSPPGDVATVLAFGREYQVGTHLGPPLAFWLADIAFRLAGGHIFGVYLAARSEGESFIDNVRRIGLAPFKAAFQETARAAA